MNARDDILANIRMRARPAVPEPESYRAPTSSDLVASFVEKARAVNTDVVILERADEVPAAIAELLRAKNLAARIHLPPESDLDLPFETLRTPPGPDDAAVTRAPIAVAETGTLVQPARREAPASWHFRPGFEIAILNAENIVARLEDAIPNPLPATVNLITGPSRTGDIEQTLELGAHGPKALAILIVK